jgi:hypothetical protein
MARVARVALPYGVRVYSGSGMDGLKPKKEAAERAAAREVPTLIGHLADFDISGGDIADAFAEDTIAFVHWHRDQNSAPGLLTVVRIGLTREQAVAHNLFDAEGKAELDGLPVPALDALIRGWIESNLDPRIQRSVVRAEGEMRANVHRLLSGGKSRFKSREDEIDSLYTGEDWAWARQ